MKHILLFATLLAALVSCQKPSNDIDNPAKPIELTTRSAEFIDKGKPFAFDFIDRINASEKNDYIVSPLSMQFLLGMILNGAQGGTAEEICDVLGYGAGEIDAVNEFCLSMLQQLPKLDMKTKLTIASAIFVDDGWPLKDKYKADVAKYYEAKVENLDFTDNDRSLKTINGWCNDHTNGLIPKILDRVDPDMLCYLLNAMYFKSDWKNQFKKSATDDEAFTDEAGVKGKVKMMKQDKTFSYLENDVFQAVFLPYGNGAFAMTVLLPQPKHTVSDVTKYLKKNGLQDSMFPCDVDLWLPRFETKYHIKLNDILSEMGMPSSFNSARADFRAMSDYAGYLDFVQQDAVIKVDEEGSEAAVVSSAGMMKNAVDGPGDHVVFHADHPFLYLITESSTGAVLFAGRYSGK